MSSIAAKVGCTTERLFSADHGDKVGKGEVILDARACFRRRPLRPYSALTKGGACAIPQIACVTPSAPCIIHLSDFRSGHPTDPDCNTQE
jgi:hypothetical protein